MSNIIRFPVATAGGTSSHGPDARADADGEEHSVQFYDDPEFLFETVARFLGAGLRSGDRMLVVAQSAHCAGIARHLEPLGGEHAIATGQLTLLDAGEVLSKFIVGGLPDPALFRETFARLIGQVGDGADPAARIRIYGEMVELLWRDGNAEAAIRLEELWNAARTTHAFSLLCSYPMGHFRKEDDSTRFSEVCRNHSYVMPTESFTTLEEPQAQLREITLLQQRARSLENEIHHRREVEEALLAALRERARVEEDLRESLEREKQARAQAEASDAFKEVFLAILGHDLRNPLNTVLTTARLMVMRGELPPENLKRLERVVVSGVRIERMIDQLLDLTRARLAGGIPVTLGTEHDLVSLVANIIAETRVAHPTRTFDFRAEGMCAARVDCDRFEQVVSNLLANAVTHGDRERPITVAITARDGVASLSVHNYGAPIAPDFMPLLFDPFKRGQRPREGRPGGLGLGLYITERIVTAHGGTISVESSREAGTKFVADFPRGP